MFKHEYFTTQSRVCYHIIKRIHRRVQLGYYFGGVKVNNGQLIEGHHRYIAYKLANIEFEIIQGQVSHCDRNHVRNFNLIDIDNIEDWDMNNLKTKKYCSDDFLNNGDFFRKIPK